MSCQRVLPRALAADDPVEYTEHLHLDPVPRHVAAARAFVREHAPPLPEDTREVLLLLTSELVTNAVLHARTAIEVGITVAGRSVLVAVHDQDLARPEQRPYDDREGGWGLGLVASLAEEAEMQVHPGGGKTAWFRVPRGCSPVGESGSATRAGQDDLGTAGA